MLAGEAEDSKNDAHILSTVVVPSYNEEEGLPVVLGRIFAAIDGRTEVLVVDDGSTDGTRAAASQFPCRVVWHNRNQGKGEAVRTGLRYARGENVIFIDADDTYPADLIPRMIALLEDHEMVVGSRSTGHMNIPAFNRIGNAIFRNSIRYFYGFKPYDPLTGFFGIKRDLMREMNLRTNNFRIESELAIKAASRGLRMADLPIEYGPRLGTAKLRGLQDGYTIFETIVRMLPRHSPAISLAFVGFAIGLLAALAAVSLHGVEGSFLSGAEPEAFFVAMLTVLGGLVAISGGVLLLGHGASQGLLHHGKVVRIVFTPLFFQFLLLAGVLILTSSVVWALGAGDQWRSNGELIALQNSQLAIFGAVAGIQFIATALLIQVIRPAQPRRAGDVETAVHSAVVVGSSDAEEGALGD